MSFRIGSGIDIHPLVPDRPLILGGINIPSEFGPDGHSDGDVLTHAICDALLGALALGDLGSFYPSNNKDLKGISSILLLEDVMKKLISAEALIVNLDATIILQRPAVSSYRLEIRKNLAKCLDLQLDQISVKATTTDHLGFIGKGEGIASICSVLIQI